MGIGYGGILLIYFDMKGILTALKPIINSVMHYQTCITCAFHPPIFDASHYFINPPILDKSTADENEMHSKIDAKTLPLS